MRVLFFLLCFSFAVNAAELTAKEKMKIYNLTDKELAFNTGLSQVDSVEWLERQARMAELINRDDIVASTLDRLLSIQPLNPEALASRCRLLFRQNKKDQAEQILFYLTREFSEHLETQKLEKFWAINGTDSARYNQLKIMQFGGRTEDAIKAYQAIFQNNFPTLHIYLNYLNLAGGKTENWQYVKKELELLNLKNPQVAILQLSLAEHISRRDPDNVWVNKILWRLATHSTVGERAVLNLLDHLADQPMSTDWARQHAILASYFPQNSKIQLSNKHAQSLWGTEQILLKDPHYRAKLKGLILLKSDNPQDIAKAYGLLKYAQATRPNDPQILEGLGKYYLKDKQSGKAIRYFKQALAVDPELNNRGKYNALLLTARYWGDLRKGDKFLKKGEIEQARINYLRAYNRDPKELYAQISLGQLALQQRNYPQAKQWFTDVLAIAPEQNSALEGLVNLIHRQAGAQSALNYAKSLCTACQIVLADRIYNLNIEVKMTKMRYFVGKKQGQRALQIIDELSALKAMPAWPCKEVADQLVALGENKRAFKFIENCQKFNKNEDMLFAYGLFLSQQGQEVKALSILKSIPQNQQSVGVAKNIKRMELDLQFSKIGQTQLKDPQKAAMQLTDLQRKTRDDHNTQLRVASIWISFNKVQHAKEILHALPANSLLNDDYLSAVQIALRAEDNDYIDLLLTDADQRVFTATQKLAFDKLLFKHRLAIADQQYINTDFQQAQRSYSHLFLSESEYKAGAAIGLAKTSQALGDEITGNMAITYLKTHRQQLAYKQHQQLVTLLYDSGNEHSANAELNNVTMRGDGSLIELSQSFDLAVEHQQWLLSERLAKKTLMLDRFENNGAEQQQSLEYLYKNADDNWLTRNVKSDIAKMRGREQGHIKFGIDYGFRKSAYNDLHIPFEAVLPFPKYDGHLLFKAEIAMIDSAKSTYYDTQQKLNHKAQGIDFALGWLAENWQFDIGLSPQGFLENNMVGGVTGSFNAGDFTLRPAISRRVNNTSVLAYSGLNFAPDGDEADQWGGVIETGVTLGLSWDQGTPMGFWASAQLSRLTGNNVYDNDKKALLGGTYYKLLAKENTKLNVGLNLFAMSFDKNLSENLFGHGGYYSPQSYFSVSLPVTFSSRHNQELSYSLFGSVSHSWSKSDAPYGETGDSSQGGGIGLTLEGLVERNIAPKWYIGAMYRIGYSDTYEPHRIQFYVKYLFNESWDKIVMPPEPIELYSNYY